LFVQDEISFLNIHKILIGLRFDYNSAHGSIFTPRLNYQWKINDKHNFRLGLGNGYRVVNVFSEDHAALTGARVVEISEALRPEKSYNLNLNYTNQTFFKGGFINFDASIFYTHFSNRIVADYFTDPNKIIFDNLKGFGISKGLTLNSDWSFVNGVKIIAGVTFMDVYTKERDEQNNYIKNRQLHASPFSGTWTASYLFKKWNLLLDYTGNFYSPMRLPILPNDFRAAYSPWFSIQNVQLSKNWKKGIELYGGIKNLLNFLPQNPIMRPFDPFDKQVNINNPFGYTFDPNYGYAAMQGRRIFMGIRYHLK
jgi:outer membrane receptor for ferrienterochelin and colicins